MHSRSNGLSEVYFGLCKFANTPFSLASWILFKSGDFVSLLEHLDSWSPERYSERDIDVLRKDYCVKTFISKYKGLNTGIDTEAVALQGFATSEAGCKEANRAFRRASTNGFNPLVERVLHTARRKIAALLGPCSLFAIEPFVEWGPGATFDLRRKEAQVDKKIAQTPFTVGRRAVDFVHSLISRDLHWSCCVLGIFPSGPFSFMRDVFSIEDSCRIVTVPKSAKTDRTIAIEPTLNLFAQKGVGGYIRSRLKRVGIDLDSQLANQEGARKALSDGMATLDLSAASDSVSKEVVCCLLPFDWADLLDSLRSHTALMPDGSVVKLEKFSSMGNGFTFELESLLFWALAASVTELEQGVPSCLIYGDDIIVPQKCSSDLITVLNALGFSVNSEKSFTGGLFFESCGKHFFGGFDVTPCYQKEELESLAEVIRCHNRLARWSFGHSLSCTVHLSLYRLARSMGHAHLPEIPFGDEGDDGFLRDFCEIEERLLRFDRNRGWRFKVLVVRSRVVPAMGNALLARCLRVSSYSEGSDLQYLWYPTKEVRGDDLELPPSREEVSRPTLGWRWIIPSGVCPR